MVPCPRLGSGATPLRAAAAHAVDVGLVRGDAEPTSFGDAGGPVLDLARRDLLDPAAASADQVVVMPRHANLVGDLARRGLEGPDHAGVCERLQRPVDGREPGALPG